MSEAVPQYLREPEPFGHVYGRVEHDGTRKAYVVTAEPCVLEMCRRLFPGCDAKGLQSDQVRFPATKRNVGDLNWLLQRYPLEMQCRDAFEADRVRAIEHALRRENLKDLQPVMTPAQFKGKLFKFQEKHAAWLLSNERTILAAEMGLGKSVTALAAAAASNSWPLLVVCESNTLIQWQNFVGQFLRLDVKGQQQLTQAEPTGKDMAFIVSGTKPRPLPQKPVIIIPYHLLQYWEEELAAIGLRAIVWDEIQNLRHMQTAKYTTASRLGSGIKFAWGLSGTPIYNYGDETWNVVNILEYHALGDRESFTREWCEYYGSRRVKNPGLLGDYLKREGLLLRAKTTDEDVAVYLPPMWRKVHVVGNDRSHYDKIMTDIVELAQSYKALGWHERGIAKRRIEETTYRATGEAKAPYVAAFIKALLEAGERVIVCAHHHSVHDHLTEALEKFRPVRVTGKETAREKEEAKRAFINGESNMIQLALRSAAGIDGLQARASCIVFAELDWSPAVHAQAEKRIQRIGVDPELREIYSYYMVTDVGTDETMQEALGIKVSQFVGIMGDVPETEDDKLLAESHVREHMDRVIERLQGKEAAAT